MVLSGISYHHVANHRSHPPFKDTPPQRVLKTSPKLLPLLLVSFLVFIPVFNACTKPACHYDLGLYYLQEIRWMETFPIVRGLGNLIWNLGFNQSAFLVTSFLDSLVPRGSACGLSEDFCRGLA